MLVTLGYRPQGYYILQKVCSFEGTRTLLVTCDNPIRKQNLSLCLSPAGLLMVGYPLFPNGHVALFSPPFPKNFQESMLELPTAQGRPCFLREAILLGGTLSP